MNERWILSPYEAIHHSLKSPVGRGREAANPGPASKGRGERRRLQCAGGAVIFNSLPPVKSAGKVIRPASLLLLPSMFPSKAGCNSVLGLSARPAANFFTSLMCYWCRLSLVNTQPTAPVKHTNKLLCFCHATAKVKCLNVCWIGLSNYWSTSAFSLRNFHFAYDIITI